jgi:transient receptor potential cation channel subfamily C
LYGETSVLLYIHLCTFASAAHGRKERILERRINKDFQIGVVEGVASDVISNVKDSKNIFDKIARAVGRNESKKKDWNALMRSGSQQHDPIGNTRESQRRMGQQNIRKLVLYASVNIKFCR